MTTAPSFRTLVRRLLVAGAILSLTAAILVGVEGAASASGERTWTLSGVTFDDGGQMTGSFDMSDTGDMTNVVITTSGGDTDTYGTSTTFDLTNASGGLGYLQNDPGQYVVMMTTGLRYLMIQLGDLSSAAEGDAVPLGGESWECFNCFPYRMVVAGSVVAGPLQAGTPPVSGALTVAAPAGLHLAGRSLPVTTSGLAAGEPYVVTVDGVQVGSGQAPGPGRFTRTVRIPAETAEGHASITVSGTGHSGSVSVEVVARKTLGLHLAKHVMAVRHRQWVTVSGLVPGEPVRVRYRTRIVSSPHAFADAHGVYRMAIHVGRLAGTKTVTARGAFYGRRATTTFLTERR